MIDIMFNLGASDARKLRSEAGELTDTEIIDREMSIPDFNPKKDYSACPKGTPVKNHDQVFKLLIPHNASHYTGEPADETMRSLWEIAHTTNPYKAKPWIAPYGVSGLWSKGECYKTEDGTVKRCISEQPTNFNAEEMPSYWEDVYDL